MNVAALTVDSVWADLKASLAATIPDVTPLPRLVMRPELAIAEAVCGVDFDGHPIYRERGSWATHSQSFNLYPDDYIAKLTALWNAARV